MGTSTWNWGDDRWIASLPILYFLRVLTMRVDLTGKGPNIETGGASYNNSASLSQCP